MTGAYGEPRDCDAFEDDLAELALGILSGRDRLAVLGHVESCERCSAELERLSLVADSLLGLAPEVEPPVGFELRLAERLQSPAVLRHAPARHRRAGILVVAALVLAVLGFGLGASIGPPGMNVRSPSVQANLTSAQLSSDGHVKGEVMLSSGKPSWMFMTVDAGAWSSKVVTCEVTLADGKVVKIGVFKLSNGYGAWGAPLPAAASKVRSARLVSPDGSVLASAQLAV